MDAVNQSVLSQNIKNAIKRMKDDGVTGCSVENLKQCTSTNGLTCSTFAFHQMFQEIALKVAGNNFILR